MAIKSLPFTQHQIESICATHPTPFHLYDEDGIRSVCRRLNAAFSWAPTYKNFFAVKATPNPHLLKIIKEEGMGADCSSIAELILSEKTGMDGAYIMFTSNETPANEYKKAIELGAFINLDDITHIPFLEKEFGHLPELLCFRYNPGPLRGGNAIIGTPEEAKYGFTREQLFEGYRLAKEKGVKRFGLHTMLASNELNPEYFVETGRMLFELVVEISKEVGIKFEFVNLGGGIGVAYRPEQTPVDLERVGAGIREQYEKIITPAGLAPLNIFTENGRVILGPNGYLVTRALHEKHIYRDYIGLDACMANLMRPALYGAYHHITVVGKENQPLDHTYDVVGSLCENNDKFAVQRALPKIEAGDLLVIHDAGAHGHAMGFNYNGKLRSAELLLQHDGSVKQIRRAETLDDLFATLDFTTL
ncbi:TPA: diaminopimelate decarboxylase [Candidatus Sumerlaeota bacterium]|nr:diaminopimelate decarboxylase [Candidatus Sumerlaeota bacterium]